MDVKQVKNAFRQNKPPAGKPHGTKKGKKGYDRIKDKRTIGEQMADHEFDRSQDARWQKAKHIIKNVGGEVTQVNEKGFYHKKPGAFLPGFVEWPPQSEIAEKGEIGRVA